jgi:hypothetical protein
MMNIAQVREHLQERTGSNPNEPFSLMSNDPAQLPPSSEDQTETESAEDEDPPDTHSVGPIDELDGSTSVKSTLSMHGLEDRRQS